jgi:hypothetical protein
MEEKQGRCSNCGAPMPELGKCARKGCGIAVCEHCLDKAISPWKSKVPMYYHKREYCPVTERGIPKS